MTIKKSVLPNGITLFYNRRENDPLVAVSFGFKVGSLFENDDNRGISHLMEHMIFNGNGSYQKEDIPVQIAGMGGYVNAHTSYDNTQFMCQALKEHFNDLTKLLFSLTFFPSFDNTMLEKEKNIVVQEILDCKDRPWNLTYETLMRGAFKSNPYKHPIIGYENVVRKITVEDLSEYHKLFYVPSNLIVSIVGDIDEELIDSTLTSLFEGVSEDISVPKLEKLNYEIFEKSNKIYKKDISQTKFYYSLLFPTEYLLEFMLIDYMYGGDMSSKLFTEIREKRQLCYSVGSSLQYLGDKSLLHAYASIGDKSKLEESFIVAKEILESFKDPVDEKLLRRAKDYIKGEMFRSLQDGLDGALNSIIYEIQGLEVDPVKYVDLLEDISSEDIQKAFVNSFSEENLISSICTLMD